MKVTLNQREYNHEDTNYEDTRYEDAKYEDEVIINYHKMNEKIERIIEIVQGNDERIVGFNAEVEYMLSIKDILYIETVDRGTFAYTMDNVYRILYTLNKVEMEFAGKGFFRCSKSMVIHLDRISELRSESGN